MSVSLGLRCVCRVTTIILGFALLSHAAPATAGYSALVVDAGSGRVLHEANADTRNYPASLTKMMTLYMVFDALDRGKWSPNRKLPVSARAAAQPPSKLGLRKGQSIKVKDAILALVTKSANDAAVVLAEALGGTESNFAVLMTTKARQLGMSRTTFRNASGLPDSRQVTTARDMALLAMALLRNFPQHYTYFSTRSFAFGGTRHGNHNRLLGHYQGADGIKTGYIRASGYNLVASARRGGRRVIGVILGGKTASQRNRQMASLLDVGFRGLDTTLADDMARPRIGLDMADVAPPSPRSLAAASSSPVSSSSPVLSPAGQVWGIQVGAFPNVASARRAAQRAVAATRSLMADGVIHVEPAGGRKTLFQARIGNLGRIEASRACGVLKQKKFKCMVFKLKQPIAIAGATSQATFDRPLTKPQSLDDAMLQISAGEEITEGDGITERERIGEGERKWGIQVGAYRSNQPALTMATMASATADELLRPGKIAVVKRKHGSRTVYLARVHGLTRSSAEAACAKLRQTAIDCLIIEVVDETQAGWGVGPVTADLGSAARLEAGGSFDNSR